VSQIFFSLPEYSINSDTSFRQFHTTLMCWCWCVDTHYRTNTLIIINVYTY